MPKHRGGDNPSEPNAPFLAIISKGDFETVDNPDGVFLDRHSIGPYQVANPKGREYSQGAGTIKGPGGNASGYGRTMRVKP